MKISRFTLGELAGVVVIAAMGFALLIPAVSRATEESKDAVCQARIKTCMTAQLTYFNDNDGVFLCWGEMNGKGGNRWSKMLVAQKLLKLEDIGCPSVEKPRYSYEGYGIRRPDDFAYNGKIRYSKGNWNLLSMKNLKSPATMVILSDTIRQTGKGQWIQHGSFSTIVRSNDKGYADARHEGKVSVAFADGHVALLEPKAFLTTVNDSSRLEGDLNATRYINLNAPDKFISGK